MQSNSGRYREINIILQTNKATDTDLSDLSDSPRRKSYREASATRLEAWTIILNENILYL